jgi:hypothetical protein
VSRRTRNCVADRVNDSSEDGSHVGVNISRSLKLVREVWARTDGSVYVDWVDILEQYDWELFMN